MCMARWMELAQVAPTSFGPAVGPLDKMPADCLDGVSSFFHDAVRNCERHLRVVGELSGTNTEPAASDHVPDGSVLHLDAGCVHKLKGSAERIPYCYAVHSAANPTADIILHAEFLLWIVVRSSAGLPPRTLVYVVVLSQLSVVHTTPQPSLGGKMVRSETMRISVLPQKRQGRSCGPYFFVYSLAFSKRFAILRPSAHERILLLHPLLRHIEIVVLEAD